MQQQQQIKQASDDRILHMSDRCREHLMKVRSEAIINGYHQQFLEMLDYCRTFSGGCEADWKSELTLDCPFRETDKSFILQVYRRKIHDGVESLVPYMTIGAIFYEDEKKWGFHS